MFKPYNGVIEGISPTIIKNVLYLTSGEFAGKVCHTVKAADYSIIFRNELGVDETIIRCRHFENEDHEREELIAVDGYMTDMVNSGCLLYTSDAADE